MPPPSTHRHYQGLTFFALDQLDMGHEDGGLFDVPLLHEDDEGARHRAERSQWRSTYVRLSQTDRLSNLEAATARTHQNRTHDLFPRRLAAVDLSSQTYDDPPPSSSIKKYRESKSMSTSPNAAQPSSSSSAPPHPSRLVTAFHLPGRDKRPQSDELPGATPMQLDTSLPSVSDLTDSVLGRVFPLSSNVSHSTEALTGATSSQSHRTQVRLTSGPEMLPNSSGHRSVKRKPVRYHAPDAPFVLPMSARIDEEEQISVLRSSDGNIRRKQAARREDRGKGTDTVSISARTGIPLPKRHIPRRDQIVLPPPLAPASTTLALPSSSPPGLSFHSHPLASVGNGFNEPSLHMLPGSVSQPRLTVAQSSPASMNHQRDKQLRRSKRTSLRRDSHSHTFEQHPAADYYTSQRTSAPIHHPIDLPTGCPHHNLRDLSQVPAGYSPASS